jgi:exonuclease SbcC
VIGAIENINKKINGKSLLKEQWEQLKKEKEEIKETVKEFDEARIKKETEINTLKEKLVTLLGLLKKKEKLDHKLALLDDLEKLFKGKRFIEYVASNQLKYISIEASKILKEITSGNYALEVDENAKFMIRDYKNGGAERDASTLSGGETFLSSLALALALSSQIQLKGTAPLELFFLDEGFGTLDNNLLEVVMEALEKIHNDKLKVGIISHVDSIKNRVPVKLLVTAAESGEGGSKVKIERS